MGVPEVVTAYGPICFGLVAVLVLWAQVVRPELKESARRITEATSAAERAAAAAERSAAAAERVVERFMEGMVGERRRGKKGVGRGG
jgi:hypothetical protein